MTAALDEKLIHDFLSALVNYPGELKTKLAQVGSVASLEISAHKADVPKLIGKLGANIDAIDMLVREMASNAGIGKMVTTLLEPAGASGVYTGPLRKFTYNPNWKPSKADDLLRGIAGAILNQPFEVKSSHQDRTSLILLLPHTEEHVKPDIRSALGLLFDVMGKVQGRIIILTIP